MRRTIKNPDSSKCIAEVSDHDPRWPHFYQCNNKPVRDGFCNRHHPDKLKEKEEAWQRRFEAESAYANWLAERKDKRESIASAVINGCSPEKQQRLVAEYKNFEANKPPETKLASWRRRF